jgi:hypothetical protein
LLLPKRPDYVPRIEAMMDAVALENKEDEEPSSYPARSYLLLSNTKKSNNFGPILRCASAFGVTQVVFVGYDKCATQGAHGADKHLSIVAYPTFSQAITYLKEKCNVQRVIGLLHGACLPISANNAVEHDDAFLYDECGTEIHYEPSRGIVTASPIPISNAENNVPSCGVDRIIHEKKSFPIHIYDEACFGGPTENVCFVFSRATSLGLPVEEAQFCDSFIHVPHAPPPLQASTNEGPSSSKLTPRTPLLDVQSCLSITLHHFTTYAGYNERTFDKFKFAVNKNHNTDIDPDEEERLRREKASKERADAKLALQVEESGQDAEAMFCAIDNGDY